MIINFSFIQKNFLSTNNMPVEKYKVSSDEEVWEGVTGAV